MKFNFIKLLLILLLIGNATMAHAQNDGPGTDFEDGGTVEDEPGLPIDNNLILLCAAGITLGVYRFSKNKAGGIMQPLKQL